MPKLSIDEIVERISERRAALPGLLVRQLELAEKSLTSAEAEKSYAATVAEIAATNGEIERLEKALEQLDKKTKENDRRAQAAAQSAPRQRISELLDERLAVASEIESAVAKLVAAWRGLIQLSDKAYTAFPNGAPPEGTALGNEELSRLLAAELFRQGHIPIVTGRTVTERMAPSLPAPRASYEFFDNPTALPAFTVEIERSNALAREVMETR